MDIDSSIDGWHVATQSVRMHRCGIAYVGEEEDETEDTKTQQVHTNDDVVCVCSHHHFHCTWDVYFPEERAHCCGSGEASGRKLSPRRAACEVQQWAGMSSSSSRCAGLHNSCSQPEDIGNSSDPFWSVWSVWFRNSDPGMSNGWNPSFFRPPVYDFLLLIDHFSHLIRLNLT